MRYKYRLDEFDETGEWFWEVYEAETYKTIRMYFEARFGAERAEYRAKRLATKLSCR